MKGEKLKQLLTGINNAKIAVIGDFCLDSYWFIDSNNSPKSVETGLPVRLVHKQKYTLGGAGNVVNNLVAMGVKHVQAYGVVGEDPFGDQMLKIMHSLKVDISNMLSQRENWNTNVYAKPYSGDTELNRMDFGSNNKLYDSNAEMLITNLNKNLSGLDLVIINQQLSFGIHTKTLQEKLKKCIKANPGKIFIVDSRDLSGEYEGSYLKINDNEAARLCGMNKDPEDIILFQDTKDYCNKLFNMWKKPVFVTRKDRGAFVQDQTGFFEIPGLHIISRIDTVGAGDSMISGIAAALACGCTPAEAAHLGNFVAGVTIQKLFETGTASPDEIMAIGYEPDYVYKSELADDIRSAAFYKNTETEIINKWPDKLKITHAIFDLDGTISTLRQGWEEVMNPVMMKAVMGDAYLSADESVYQKVQKRILDFIDKTTGIQTIEQMKGLVEIVREFGLVPNNKILDEFKYKEIYRKGLLELVEKRLKKYQNKELSVEDFTIKNAVPFIKRMHDAGIKLYLASGTDEQDVINEVKEMGYADLFEKRIYGSVGDVNKDAKKMVLERIMKDIGEENIQKLVAFGDGPVEMRETHKRGGLTVGVASDEVRRFGLNIHKRKRLIKSGADIIIPDFCQMNKLLEIMQIK
jgi:rfaE bifunctional protein kinase chain/domain